MNHQDKMGDRNRALPDPGARRKSGGFWEHFPHVADIGVRGFGVTLSESFEQAALALSSVVTSLETIHPKETIAVHCTAPNIELLFVDWLNAIVFEMATRKMLFCDFRVRIEGNELNGEARGEKICVKRHAPAAEVKGATLSELQVREEPDGLWLVQCIVDV